MFSQQTIELELRWRKSFDKILKFTLPDHLLILSLNQFSFMMRLKFEIFTMFSERENNPFLLDFGGK